MTKFIFIDGPDDAGKTTLVKNICAEYDQCIEITYKKKINGKLFKINSENDFEILKIGLQNFDKSKIYLFDRWCLSNMVYDKLLNGPDITPSLNFRQWVHENLNCLELILTRPKIEKDFIDDNISINKNVFNDIIDEYSKLGTNFDIINNKSHFDNVNEKIKQFIHS